MNGQKPLLRALAGESLAHPPFWLMRQAGRYLPEYRALRQKAGSFLGLCYTPDFAAEATLQPIRRFGMDGAILFSDILVIADALNRAVDFVEGDGPRVAPIATADDLAGEPAPGKLAPVYDALRRIKTELPNDTALIGFAGGPWTVATYLIEGGRSDFSRAKHWAFAETERLDRVIDRLVDATIQHLAAQIDAGAEIVQLFDSWADMLPEAQFHRFVIQPTRRFWLPAAQRWMRRFAPSSKRSARDPSSSTSAMAFCRARRSSTSSGSRGCCAGGNEKNRNRAVQSRRPRFIGGGKALSVQSVLRPGDHPPAEPVALDSCPADRQIPRAADPANLRADRQRLAAAPQYAGPGRGATRGAGGGLPGILRHALLAPAILGDRGRGQGVAARRSGDAAALSAILDDDDAILLRRLARGGPPRRAEGTSARGLLLPHRAGLHRRPGARRVC